MIAAALEHAVATGEESVKRGPQLLAALRDAGVVDAGGYGLTIMFAGRRGGAARGGAAPARPPRAGPHHPPPAQLGDLPLLHQLRRHRQRPARRAASARRSSSSATRCWWWATRARSRSTSTPTTPSGRRRCSPGIGEVSRLDVADMRVQVAERDSRLAAEPAPAGANGAHAGGPGRPFGCSAPASRPCAAARSPSPTATGSAGCSQELGVHTVDGGATMNPSTYDLLAGVHAVPAEEVVLMPNSPNVIMAAQHAAQLSDKEVLVAPTTSQQAGLAAALALAPDALGRGERARDRRGARTGAHRSRRAGRPRRRPGALQARRSGRLRPGRGARLGRRASRRCGRCWPSSSEPVRGRSRRRS